MNTPSDDKMLVTLTRGELRQLVREEVERGMREQTGTVRASPWVDVAAAATHFACSRQTIRNWIRSGAPARQIGTSTHPQFRIHLEQFEAWMQALHQGRGVATK